MNRKVHDIGLIFISLALGSLALVGCQGTKALTENQKLYTGADLQFESEADIPDFKEVERELYGLVKPQPNKKFLGMRPALTLHNSIREPKKDKGLRHWLKYKIGKPPVLFDEEIIRKSSALIANNLYHKGHFHAETEYQLDEKKHTVSVEYIIRAGNPYLVDSLSFPYGISPLENDIRALQTGTIIERGDHYDLNIIKDERRRIDQELKKQGYYYFDPDYLIFRADTSESDKKVRLFLQVKSDNPKNSYLKYKLHDVRLHDDYSLQNYAPDTFLLEGYEYVTQYHAIRPEIVMRAVQIHKDTLYSISDHRNTITQLTGMDYYRYATITYSENDTINGHLDAQIFMTPHKKISLSAELNAVSKSNNFAGPGVRVGVKDRNIFGGAETLDINFTGRFETQFAGEGIGNTAYEISADATLSVPRLIPVNFRKRTKKYVPYTRFQTGGGIFERTNLYRFNTFNTSIGYLWRSSPVLSHEFKTIDVSYTNLADASDEFRDFLLQNPSLRRSFEEQFIIGATYNFTINKLSSDFRRNYLLNIGLETAGNTVTLLMRPFKKEAPNPDNPYTLFGNALSQFFRFRIDTRYHFNVGEKSRLASRLFIGAGFPYGNSTTIPYIKQFFVGGTNSLRGFRARSVGPGTYQPADSLQNLQVDQTGEIKIEANAEYRFPIAGYLKGAFFVEAGNTWLVNEDEARPGGVFDFNEFYKEFAISSGFGLRIDADIFVLRFDWGFPIRKPWLSEGNRWVVKDVDFFSKDWRKKNLILNISIGYPF